MNNRIFMLKRKKRFFISILLLFIFLSAFLVIYNRCREKPKDFQQGLDVLKNISIAKFSKKLSPSHLKDLNSEEIKYLNRNFPAKFFWNRNRATKEDCERIVIVLDYNSPTNSDYRVYMNICDNGYIIYFKKFKYGFIKVYAPKYVKAVYKICKKHNIELPPLEIRNEKIF